MAEATASTSPPEARTATFCKNSVIRGHHVFKAIWNPFVGEQLQISREEGNAYDNCAVSVKKDSGTIVGHVPREMSRLFWHFLQHGGNITCEVSGRRKRGKGLEVPCMYVFRGIKELIARLETLLSSRRVTNSCPY